MNSRKIMNIDKMSNRYMQQQLLLAVAVSLVALLVMSVWFLDLLTQP